MRNRVLLCTSALQVVNAKSVIDFLGKDSMNHIIILHPALLDVSKNIIFDIGEKLGYNSIIDLTHINQKLSEKNKEFSLKQSILTLKVKAYFNNRINNYEFAIKTIKTIIEDKIGVVDEIFYRMGYKHDDALFIRAIDTAKLKYGIEDGIGDYLPKHWKYKKFNKHEILHVIKRFLKSIFKSFLSIITTGKIKESRKIFLKPKIPWDMNFCNIRYKKREYVDKYFLKNIRRLFVEEPESNKKEIIIFGSLIPDPRFEIDTKREVEIYNAVIKKIIQRHKVNQSNIWYKPHPRLEHKSWLYKKKNLDCNIYDYDKNTLGEIELCNPFIKAVYSVGSTSFLYAKELFNIDAYRIDIRSEDVHPSHHEKYHTILSSFGIEEIIP